MTVSLEHRYFGESLPFGQEFSFTRENISYLTLQNVMADAVIDYCQWLVTPKPEFVVLLV
jgi:hypothetical protein